VNALQANTVGNYNTALGVNSLETNSTGSNDIAIGYAAGSLIVGSNDIDIGAVGGPNDNGTIRIGTPGTQEAVFIAGIESAKVTGNAVYVTANGKLGVLASAERYKTAIQSMGSNTDKLQLLRPVTFHLKTEPNGAVQYGLIAEEVNKVYPELVIHDEAGAIQGVRYDELAPMLLNEVQRLQQKNGDQEARISRLVEKLDDLQQQMAELDERSKDQRLANRN
jgi:Chaperone of endosialidase